MCNIAHLSCCTIVEMRSKHFCNETPSPSLSYINNIQSLRNMMWLLYNSTYVNRPYTILELKTVAICNITLLPMLLPLTYIF